MSEPNATYFQVTNYTSQGGYAHVRVVIKAGRAIPLTEAVAECQAGKRYCDEEVNERVAPRLQELSEQGFNTLFDHYSGDMYICIEWQVYKREAGKTEYCQPSYESLGQEFNQIERAMKFLRKVGSRVETVRARQASKKHGYKVSKADTRNDTFRSVEEVVEALKFLKAVQVQKVSFGSYDHYEVAA